MPDSTELYRRLQQHLDRQPVGFPAVPSGADLQLLERLFSPEEAQIALHLSYRPAALAEIAAKAAPLFSIERTERLLKELGQKGVISWKQQNGTTCWYLVPLLIGMYEFVALGGAVPGFEAVVRPYMETQEWGRTFVSTRPSQMRAIPIGESLPVEHAVAPYDDIRALVRQTPGPFVLIPCVCREGSKRAGKSCQKTSRLETCLALDYGAAMLLQRKVGREVSRQEFLEALRLSEEEGLVLQPANTQRPHFFCACCGCCCGLLMMQKRLPRPVDFWASNYQVGLDADACSSCGDCIERCQVNALTLADAGGVQVNLARCIGCGLCVPACPTQALQLKAKVNQVVPPQDELALQEEILRNRSMTATNSGRRG